MSRRMRGGTILDKLVVGSGGINSQSGAAGSGTTAGGAGSTLSATAGAGGAKTGTGAAAGGAGAAVAITTGAGGNTASAGTDAGGAGGTLTLTGGAGGNATAGTGNGGNGASIVLAPGAGGTTTGGTAGITGMVRIGGATPKPLLLNVSRAALADADATLTDAQHRGGVISMIPTVARTVTTRTAAQLVAAFPGIAVGNAVMLFVCNASAGAFNVVLAGGAGVTLVGSGAVSQNLSAGFLLVATNVGGGTEAFDLVRCL